MRRCWSASSAALTLALLVVAAGFGHAADSPVVAGHVQRVIDGDTLEVRLDSGPIRVRLHGVDAPERNQPGGAESALWLRTVLQDQEVLLEPVSQDRYERMVAVVHFGDLNINQQLVRVGHAWAYRHYLRRKDGLICDLEADARTGALGLWAEQAPRAPWEFRRRDGKGPFTDFSASTSDDCRRAIGR